MEEDLRSVLEGAPGIRQRALEAFDKQEYYRAVEIFGKALARLETLGETKEDEENGLRASIHYGRARALYRIEDFRRSAEDARRCVELNPAHGKARAILEDLTPNIAGALAGKQSVENDPEAGQQQQELGTKSAINLVKGILQMKDEGNSEMQNGRFQSAADVYTNALSRLVEVSHEVVSLDTKPLTATLLSNRAQAMIQLEFWAKARSDAEEALEAQPDNSKARLRLDAANKGLESIQDRRIQGESLKKAIAFKSSGNSRLAEKDARAAAAEYTKGLECLEAFPKSHSAAQSVRVVLLANRCQAQIGRRLWNEARADADAVLFLDPQHHKAKFRRAKALFELSCYAEANADLEQLLALEPCNTDVQILLDRTVQAVNTPESERTAKATDHTGRHSFRAGDKVEVKSEFSTSAERYLARGELGLVVQASRGAKLHVEFKDGVHRIDQGNFSRLKKIRDENGPNADRESESRRLFQESELALKSDRITEARSFANGAVSFLEAEIASLLDGSDNRGEKVDPWWLRKNPSRNIESNVCALADELLSVYAQKVRTDLASKDFRSAGECAARATKLRKWMKEEQLENKRQSFGQTSEDSVINELAVISSAASELSSAVAAIQGHSREGGPRLFQAVDSAKAGLRLLDREAAWKEVGNLREELLAVRGQAEDLLGISGGY